MARREFPAVPPRSAAPPAHSFSTLLPFHDGYDSRPVGRVLVGCRASGRRESVAVVVVVVVVVVAVEVLGARVYKRPVLDDFDSLVVRVSDAERERTERQTDGNGTRREGGRRSLIIRDRIWTRGWSGGLPASASLSCPSSSHLPTRRRWVGVNGRAIAG